jgi:tRNA threonylcarbamoyladenosine biosynthesis protein TsaB
MEETTAKILAIDASTGPCSVAIWDGSGVSAYIEQPRPVMQSASLLPMIEEAMRQSGADYRDLSAVACTLGPGSFTGIRVGLASARGIAYAAGIAGVGYTTFDVLAFAARRHVSRNTCCIMSILNAGKGEWYYQRFATGPYWQPVSEPRVGSLEEAINSAAPLPVIMAGNATIVSKGITACGVTFPRADALAELAATASASAQPLRPFYIRPPDAKLPAKFGQLT